LFQAVLGEGWGRLAAPVRRHYDLAMGEDQIVAGVMAEIDHAAWLAPVLWLAGRLEILVPYRGREVPVEVRHTVPLDQPAEQPSALPFLRTFHFPGHPPAVFRSRMEALGPGEVVEWVGPGFGLVMAVTVREDGALVYTGRRYVWRLGGVCLPLPGRWVLGQARIVESAAGPDAGEVLGGPAELRLDFDLLHPWWGRSFCYRGRFRIVEGQAPNK
jgi:hypothetical protein